METTFGGCACGAVRYEFTGEPVMMGHCQCRACQRDSGTGHASHVAVLGPGFTITGPIKYWASKADSGNIVSRGFCNECGSPVASKNSGMQTLMFVRAASLDDPTIYKPQMVVWSGMGQPWDHFNPALPSFERMPPGM
jgi:hypothetical protein